MFGANVAEAHKAKGYRFFHFKSFSNYIKKSYTFKSLLFFGHCNICNSR
jgi:hypothetical protein